MDEVTRQAVLSAIRQLLGIVGTILASYGVVKEEVWSQALGPAMAVIALFWGVADKYIAERKTRAREQVAFSAGTSTMLNAAVNSLPANQNDLSRR